MVELKKVNIRISEERDRVYLQRWLSDEKILNWFPMVSQVEIEDAIRIWLSYAQQGASFTAVIGDKPVAMAVLYLHAYQKLMHQSLFAIIVDPSCRGQGIGTLLFEKLKVDAKEKFGIELLHLEVYEGNPAFNLYKRLGFKEYGRHKEFLKEAPHQYRNKILMEQIL